MKELRIYLKLDFLVRTINNKIVNCEHLNSHVELLLLYSNELNTHMNTQINYENMRAIENALTLMNICNYREYCKICNSIYNQALLAMNDYRESKTSIAIDVKLRVNDSNEIHLSSVSITNYAHILFEVNEKNYKH